MACAEALPPSDAAAPPQPDAGLYRSPLGAAPVREYELNSPYPANRIDRWRKATTEMSEVIRRVIHAHRLVYQLGEWNVRNWLLKTALNGSGVTVLQ